MWGLSIPSLFLLYTLPLGTSLMSALHRKIRLLVLPPKVVPKETKLLKQQEETVLPPPYICNHFNMKHKRR